MQNIGCIYTQNLYSHIKPYISTLSKETVLQSSQQKKNTERLRVAQGPNQATRKIWANIHRLRSQYHSVGDKNMEKRCRKSPYPYQSSVKKPHSKPRRSSGKWLQLLLFLCFPDPAVNKGSKRIIGICEQKTAKLLKNWDSSSQQPGTLDLLKSACQGFQVLDSCLPIWHSTKSFTGHLYRRFRNLKRHNCHFRSTLIHGAFTKKRTQFATTQLILYRMPLVQCQAAHSRAARQGQQPLSVLSGRRVERFRNLGNLKIQSCRDMY